MPGPEDDLALLAQAAADCRAQDMHAVLLDVLDDLVRLAAAQGRHAQALEAAGLDLWEYDLITGNVTRKATKTFEELGFTEDEIVSGVQDIYGLFHPDDIDTVRRAVADHLTGGFQRHLHQP